MSPTNQAVWYRHPGSSFYILANKSVPTPRLFVRPGYYNQSHQINNYPQQRVTMEEVEETEEVYHADEELDDSFLDVGSGESAMDSVDELESYDEDEAIVSGDLDGLLCRPISICSWLSTGMKELTAENLGGVNGEIGGDIDAGESSKVVVDGAVVEDVLEDKHPADLHSEVHDEIGRVPELQKGQQCVRGQRLEQVCDC